VTTIDHPGRVLLDRGGIDERVRRLGKEIARDHPDGVVLIIVLKGALVFAADLARVIPEIDVQIDFLSISRYAPDSGRVKILHDLELDVAGRDLVLVEDLVDTGLTLAYLLEHLRSRGPRRVEVCTLFDRAERRIVPIAPRYVGEELPGTSFVLGYGLHVEDRYRNLPFVIEGDPTVARGDPGAYLPWYDSLQGGVP